MTTDTLNLASHTLNLASHTLKLGSEILNLTSKIKKEHHDPGGSRYTKRTKRCSGKSAMFSKGALGTLGLSQEVL